MQSHTCSGALEGVIKDRPERNRRGVGTGTDIADRVCEDLGIVYNIRVLVFRFQETVEKILLLSGHWTCVFPV